MYVFTRQEHTNARSGDGDTDLGIPNRMAVSGRGGGKLKGVF